MGGLPVPTLWKEGCIMAYNACAFALFVVSGVLVGINLVRPEIETNLPCCGFAIAGGLALVAGAIHGNKGASALEKHSIEG
jgi:hypothetical protein